MRRRLPLLLAALCVTSVASSHNSWFTEGFFHEGDGSATDQTEWVVQITSVARRRMTCRVIWTGVRTAPLDHNRPQGVLNGIITIAVPAYSGSGPAVLVAQGFPNIRYLKQHTICS